MRQYQYGTARALLAFRDPNNHTQLALMGALLWGEHIDNMRGVNAFLKSLGRGANRSSGKGGVKGRRK